MVTFVFHIEVMSHASQFKTVGLDLLSATHCPLCCATNTMSISFSALHAVAGSNGQWQHGMTCR